MNPTTSQPPPPLVWWALWCGITGGLLALHLTIPVVETPATNGLLRHIPLFPLLASSAIRWVALPRISQGSRAFLLYIMGLALAEGGSVLGLFLVPDLRQTYLVLGVAGLAQYVPFFASRYRPS